VYTYGQAVERYISRVATRWSRALCGETAKERGWRQFPRNIINMSLVGEIRDLNLRTPETAVVSFT